MHLDEKYYLIYDTTNSDSRNLPKLTDDEIAEHKQVINNRKIMIDDLLDKIDLLRQLNYTCQHQIIRSLLIPVNN